MTGKERIKNAILGEKVDRVPIWLREGFFFFEEIPNESHFTCGWKSEETYRELFSFASEYADTFFQTEIDILNRYVITPPKYINKISLDKSTSIKEIHGTIHTPKGNLQFIDEIRKGLNTSWHQLCPVHCAEDLKKLLSIPFEVDLEALEKGASHCKRLIDKIGDRGLLRLEIPSPIVAISRCMEFQDFLEMTALENEFIHEALKEITRRELIIVEALLEKYPLDVAFNFGGAEQCTPPMMSPHSFDEFVVPYDSQVVSKIKQYEIPVTCHCHGRVRHALGCMMEVGYQATDPVEAPPSGDITFEEARKLTKGRLTLMGNLQFNELEFATTDQIRERVKEILSFGKERLVVGASAGPISRVSEKLAQNYRVLIETAVEYGST